MNYHFGKRQNRSFALIQTEVCQHNNFGGKMPLLFGQKLIEILSFWHNDIDTTVPFSASQCNCRFVVLFQVICAV